MPIGYFVSTNTDIIDVAIEHLKNAMDGFRSSMNREFRYYTMPISDYTSDIEVMVAASRELNIPIVSPYNESIEDWNNVVLVVFQNALRIFFVYLFVSVPLAAMLTGWLMEIGGWQTVALIILSTIAMVTMLFATELLTKMPKYLSYKYLIDYDGTFNGLRCRRLIGVVCVTLSVFSILIGASLFS